MRLWLILAAGLLQGGGPAPRIRLITLDPGHFHAALIQKEMYPGVSKQVAVYAPLGPDLVEHLGRVARFNSRKENPTAWQLQIHAGPDFLERMLAERPGNVVVLSGRNREKIGRINASLAAGLNVLADKPWIISAADLGKIETALETARRRGLVAYDIMTERYEITSMLQRELVGDREVFGTAAPGSEAEPGVSMESVHHLFKSVAGAPNLRPPWFFDIAEQGDALADVGTHLVDLVQWTLFPEQPIDYRRDIKLLAAKRWPVVLTRSEFQRVTGEPELPGGGNRFDYNCNKRISYTLRGVHVRLDVLWAFESAPGAGDTYTAVFRGSRARVEIRQAKEQNYRPELYIVPVGDRAPVLKALRRKIAALDAKFPGLAVEDTGREFMIRIPDRYRVGHEAHFAQVTQQFFSYLGNPGALPAWEQPNMLAKYYVTTGL